MAKAVGIDLGTTNSVIAPVMEGGRPTVIPNAGARERRRRSSRSPNSGERLVGQLARRQAILNRKGTIYSAKRFIGRRFDEVQSDTAAVSYDVVPGPDGMVRFNIRRQALRPRGNLSSRAPQACRRRRQVPRRKGNRGGDHGPRRFNDAQRQATKDAGKIAGLESFGSSTSRRRRPSRYGLDKRANETVLVFDLGGGTFDVSILDVGDGVVEVRATSGDTHLGGDDFDRRLVDHLADEFQPPSRVST